MWNVNRERSQIELQFLLDGLRVITEVVLIRYTSQKELFWL